MPIRCGSAILCMLGWVHMATSTTRTHANKNHGIGLVAYATRTRVPPVGLVSHYHLLLVCKAWQSRTQQPSELTQCRNGHVHCYAYSILRVSLNLIATGIVFINCPLFYKGCFHISLLHQHYHGRNAPPLSFFLLSTQPVKY